MAYSAEKRQKVVTKYVQYGNVRRVAAEEEIPVETLFTWMKEDWWKTLEQEVRSGVRSELTAKMHGIVDRSLDILSDRLENGELVLNMKTGETIRRPVPARDVQKIATEILGKKISLEKEVDKKQIRQETVQEMLSHLAKGLMGFTKKVADEQKVIDNVSDIPYREVTSGG